MTEKSVVVAGPLAFYAKARAGLVMGRARDTLVQARADLAEIDRLLDQCPRHQLPAAVQAAMSIFED